MKEVSQQLFLDFLGEPADSPRRQRPGIYDARTFGPQGRRTHIILLDTRFFRDALTRRPGVEHGDHDYQPTPDVRASILGETQWQWLEAQLRVPAELHIIVSSIQVIAEDHGGEKWANFPHERERLFRLIRDTGAGGVLFISGDMHNAELSRMDTGEGSLAYDLTSSGLNSG